MSGGAFSAKTPGQVFMTENPFISLIERARKGDAGAASQLVADYEPQIRRVARARISNPIWRREFDSLDICQSVLASFFTGLALGQYEVDSPEQLVKLLAAIARHKTINRIERQRAAKRDLRRNVGADAAEIDVAQGDQSPSQVVAVRELLGQFTARLSPDELDIVEQRAEGRSWQELSQQYQSAPDALRVRHRRALTRVRTELGWDDDVIV
jgi:RNA polymerase sigma factor (sigma-70 family)